MKTFLGIATYSGRNQPQPETLTNTSALAQIFFASGFAHAVVTAVGRVAVNPASAQAEPIHHLAEILDVVAAIFADGVVDRVIRPRLRVFEIPHLVPELAKSLDELQVIPRHPAKRVLPDQSRDDDPHAASLY